MARKRHRMTPKRKAALRKAQLASARKRRSSGVSKARRHISRNRGKYIAGAAAVAVVGGAVARHKLSGSQVQFMTGTNTSLVTGKRLGQGVRTTRNGLTTHVHAGVRDRKYSVRYTHNKLLRFEGGAHDDTRNWGLIAAAGSLGVKTPSHYGVVSRNARRVRPIHLSDAERYRLVHNVDRDAIPLYNPKASKSWPHVGAPQARRINSKLREKGMLG